MKWSQFKNVIDGFLASNGIKDAEIEYIDVSYCELSTFRVDFGPNATLKKPTICVRDVI